MKLCISGVSELVGTISRNMQKSFPPFLLVDYIFLLLMDYICYILMVNSYVLPLCYQSQGVFFFVFDSISN